MDRRRLNLITWCVLVLTVAIVAMMLMSNLRRSSRVTLPDTSGNAGDIAAQPSENGDLTVVEITPKTVQAAVETLDRPEHYSRTVTVEYLWNSDSSAIEMSTSVSGNWTRVDRMLPDGQIRHLITNGENTWIWYNDESAVYSGPAGEISADAEQAIPTYEDLLSLSAEHIVQADYRLVSDVRCIYVETAEDDWGYAQRYWVSVDTGLLVVAERLEDSVPVYRMAALDVEQTSPAAERFTLPDGTVLLTA